MTIDVSKFGPEEAALGSCLRWNSAIGDVADVVTAEDFRTDANRKVWACVSDLWVRGGPVDTVTVFDELLRRGWSTDVPPTHLAALWDHQPTGALAAHYAKIVRDRAIIRDLHHAGLKLQAIAETGAGTGDELLDEAERVVFGVADRRMGGQSVQFDAALAEAAEQIDARVLRYRRDEEPDDPVTGFYDLDLKLGPLSPGGLTLVAARTSVGKTAFGLAVTRNVVLQQRKGTFFVSLEMSKLELTERLLSAEARVNGFHIQRGTLRPDEQERLVEARDRMSGAPLWIDDAPHQTPLRIVAAARRHKLRNDIKLVVVDYVQFVATDQPKLPRHEQVASIVKRLRGLAREVGVHVLAMCQVNRNPDGRGDGKPRLADLRESGSLEMDADKVILLHRNESAPDCIEVNVAKHRNGPTGELKLSYAKEYTRFGDWAPSMADTRH